MEWPDERGVGVHEVFPPTHKLSTAPRSESGRCSAWAGGFYDWTPVRRIIEVRKNLRVHRCHGVAPGHMCRATCRTGVRVPVLVSTREVGNRSHGKVAGKRAAKAGRCRTSPDGPLDVVAREDTNGGVEGCDLLGR